MVRPEEGNMAIRQTHAGQVLTNLSRRKSFSAQPEVYL
jgi:hypothetical protein